MVTYIYMYIEVSLVTSSSMARSMTPAQLPTRFVELNEDEFVSDGAGKCRRISLGTIQHSNVCRLPSQGSVEDEHEFRRELHSAAIT